VNWRPLKELPRPILTPARSFPTQSYRNSVSSEVCTRTAFSFSPGQAQARSVRLSKQLSTSRLALTRQRIGVVTYTNVACDEILRRLDYDSRITVSTIHALRGGVIARVSSPALPLAPPPQCAFRARADGTEARVRHGPRRGLPFEREIAGAARSLHEPGNIRGRQTNCRRTNLYCHTRNSMFDSLARPMASSSPGKNVGPRMFENSALVSGGTGNLGSNLVATWGRLAALPLGA
jgi:hypothetical protein